MIAYDWKPTSLYGVLRYKVDARDPDDGSRGYVRGKLLFDLMLSHYGNRVVMIAGFWVKGDNLRLFNQHTALGLTKSRSGFKNLDGHPGRTIWIYGCQS